MNRKKFTHNGPFFQKKKKIEEEGFFKKKAESPRSLIIPTYHILIATSFNIILISAVFKFFRGMHVAHRVCSSWLPCWIENQG